MAAMEKIDWSDCPLVEVKPRVQNGAPVLRGTRMPVTPLSITSIMASAPLKSQHSLKYRPDESRRF